MQRTRDREHIVGTSMQRHKERESKSKRAREQESKRARERESKTARERESGRVGQQESERARERESERARERERERNRENLLSALCGHVGKRAREGTHSWSFVDTIPQRMRE